MSNIFGHGFDSHLLHRNVCSCRRIGITVPKVNLFAEENLGGQNIQSAKGFDVGSKANEKIYSMLYSPGMN